MNRILATKNLLQHSSMVCKSFKFYQIQILDNLTKEAYSGVSKRPSGILSVSRDTLNPLLNTQTLKNRLGDIEHYKYINGVQFAHWPHFALTRFANHLNRYKFNYAIKGFAAYIIYRDLAQYKHHKNTSFVTMQQEMSFVIATGLHTGVFVGLLALI